LDNADGGWIHRAGGGTPRAPIRCACSSCGGGRGGRV